MRFHLCAAAVFALTFSSQPHGAEALHPVVLINSLAGAKLVAKLDKATYKPPHFFCPSSGSLTMWVDPFFFLPGMTDCFNSIMSMTYDPETGIYHDTPGVSIDTLSFGPVDSVAYSDIWDLRPDFQTIISALTNSSLGYEAGKNIFAAPYDWRLAPDGLAQRGYFDRLQALIEQVYTDNDNSAVALIAHSLGGSATHAFLSLMTQEWRDKYVAKFIGMAPVFGGSIQTVQAVISGMNFGLPEFLIPENFAYPVEASVPSLQWMFAKTGNGLWSEDEVIVQTPSRNYTAFDYIDIYRALNYTMGEEVYKAVSSIPSVNGFEAPNIDTYILYGTGLDTAVTYVYGEDIKPIGPNGHSVMPNPVQTIMSDGDNTLLPRSPLRAQSWKADHAAHGVALEFFEFPKASHGDIINTAAPVAKVVEILSS